MNVPSKADLLAKDPHCAECRCEVQKEPGGPHKVAAVMGMHLLCQECDQKFKRLPPEQWRERMGLLRLKALLPPEERQADINDDPQFVFKSFVEVTPWHWQTMAKRMLGYARAIIGRRTTIRTGKMIEAVSLRIVQGVIDGAVRNHLKWDPTASPNLLAWFISQVRQELDAVLPPDFAVPHHRRQRGGRGRGMDRRRPQIQIPTLLADEWHEVSRPDAAELEFVGIA